MSPLPPASFGFRSGSPLALGTLLVALCGVTLLQTGCATKDREHRIVISVPEQKLVVLKREHEIAEYPVSTSKFGLGSRVGSMATPLGHHEVAKKIGKHAVAGTVFKDRKPTGEVIPVDAPGRDPIVTRIIWLKGLDRQNANSYARHIYIHGTPEERNIGHPASYGCIRMRSRDVSAVFDTIGVGARVDIVNEPVANVLTPPN